MVVGRFVKPGFGAGCRLCAGELRLSEGAALRRSNSAKLTVGGNGGHGYIITAEELVAIKVSRGAVGPGLAMSRTVRNAAE